MSIYSNRYKELVWNSSWKKLLDQCYRILRGSRSTLTWQFPARDLDHPSGRILPKHHRICKAINIDDKQRENIVLSNLPIAKEISRPLRRSSRDIELNRLFVSRPSWGMFIVVNREEELRRISSGPCKYRGFCSLAIGTVHSRMIELPDVGKIYKNYGIESKLYYRTVFPGGKRKHRTFRHSKLRKYCNLFGPTPI